MMTRQWVLAIVSMMCLAGCSSTPVVDENQGVVRKKQWTRQQCLMVLRVRLLFTVVVLMLN